MSVDRTGLATSILSALVGGLCLLCAPSAHAQQDTLGVAARLVMLQPRGVVLRLDAGSGHMTGALDRIAAGMLYLDSPPRSLALSSVTHAWLQRRATRGGGKLGAVVGVPAGAVVFGLGTWVASQMCDNDCDISTRDYVAMTLVGGAAGATTGYIVGALIGSTVPRWEPLTESSVPAAVIARNPRLHAGLSVLDVTPAVARDANGEAGASLAISYLSQLSGHIGLGAEVAMYGVITREPSYLVSCSRDSELLCERPGDVSNAAWNAGSLARIGTGAHRVLEPYLLLGLGIINFGDAWLGSYSAGAGTRYRVTRRFAVSGQVRWHSKFTNSGGDTQLDFYSFGAALSLLR